MNQFSQEEKYQLGLGSGQQLTFQTASDTLTPVRNSKLKFNYTSQLKLNLDDNNIQGEASLYVPQTVNITP
jgi:hypothetical protein